MISYGLLPGLLFADDVAFVAHAADKGGVGFLLEEFGVLGCMGVMATDAVHGFRGNSQVSLGEGSILDVVALLTEGRWRLREKWRLGR